MLKLSPAGNSGSLENAHGKLSEKLTRQNDNVFVDIDRQIYLPTISEWPNQSYQSWSCFVDFWIFLKSIGIDFEKIQIPQNNFSSGKSTKFQMQFGLLEGLSCKFKMTNTFF